MTGQAGTSLRPDFVWGAATSAYQIEGSPLADGAGPSNWHRFSHTPGNTHNGETGDIACDHYRRWRDDIALLQQLGVGAYRFSTSWSRILPEGTGRLNRPGIDFYSRLVDALQSAGIRPYLTLYHWDLPAALDDRGGWLNADIAGWFADYAIAAHRALGDRISYWTTLNEPWVVMDAGYLHGVHAPGHRSVYEAPIVAHNLLRAHATAVQALRAEGSNQVGIVVNLEPKSAATDRAEDVAATARAEAYMNRLFLDPLRLGHWPEQMPDVFGDAWAAVESADMRLISEPIDFLGINYYTRNVMRAAPGTLPPRAVRVRQDRAIHTELDWEVHPQSLQDVLEWVASRYGSIPLYVTENGAAFADPAVADTDVVEDPMRVDYYREHLRAARRAVASGVDLRGYFAWSLLDNYEWSAGYSKRFGLYHVDFSTLKRTPKRSSYFYADVVRSNGRSVDNG